MKYMAVLSICVLACTSSAFCESTFDELKSLVGEWTGSDSGGAPLSTKYELISGGTAVMESLEVAEGSEMVSIYYPDGSDVMMTHVCLANNQPRLKSSDRAAPGVIVFQFVDVTNLEDPMQEHIRGLVLRLQDSNHISEEWTHRQNGEDRKTVFEFVRKQEDASSSHTPFCMQYVHAALSLMDTIHRPLGLDYECTGWAAARGSKEIHKSQCLCRKCDCK